MYKKYYKQLKCVNCLTNYRKCSKDKECISCGKLGIKCIKRYRTCKCPDRSRENHLITSQPRGEYVIVDDIRGPGRLKHKRKIRRNCPNLPEKVRNYSDQPVDDRGPLSVNNYDDLRFVPSIYRGPPKFAVRMLITPSIMMEHNEYEMMKFTFLDH